MNRVILSLVSFFYCIQIFAQTPPARTWHYNNRGIKTTVKERWDEDAQGLQHGTYIKYFEDGEREILGHNIHGKANGQWEFTVYSNVLFQQVKSITYVNFVNGQQQGLYKTVSGDLTLVQGNYTNGVKTGYWKDDFDLDEKVYSEGNYLNGKRNGEWKNTLVAIKSNDEMAFGILTGNANSEKTEIKKGYRTIYKNGEVQAVYDDKGVNLIEKQKQEDVQRLEEEEFKKCNTISDFENFRKKHPYSEFDSDAIIQINKLKKKAEDEVIAKKKQEEEKVYVEPLINKWNSITDKVSIVYTFWNEYFQKYPKGTYYNEIKRIIEVVENYRIQTKEICDCDYNNLNQITSDKGSIPFDFSIAMEIKQKFGINIFRYMNYEGKFNNSFLFIENYPNIQNIEDVQKLKSFNNNMKDKTLSYKISNGKLSEIVINNEEKINMRGDKIIYTNKFDFDKEGKIKSYTYKNKNTYTYEAYKRELEFDTNGRLIKHNCGDSINLEMFK